MYRAERHDVFGRCKNARRPGEGLQTAAVMVGLAAIALPAAERQQEVEPGGVGHFGGGKVLRPGAFPAFRCQCRRQAARTVQTEQTQFEAMAVEAPRGGGIQNPIPADVPSGPRLRGGHLAMAG